MKQVQLIDAGTGNLQSVYNALHYLGATISIVQSPHEWKPGTRTVLPGVGAFRKFIEGLSNRQLVEPVMRTVQRDIPLLGICVGMQALLDGSEEMGNSPGLGIIPGIVPRFPVQDDYKVPQTGWNQVRYQDGKLEIFKGIESGSYFYFNHSFYCKPQLTNLKTAETNYIQPFISAFAWNNVFGVQFHPEKSQVYGLKILENFLLL